MWIEIGESETVRTEQGVTPLAGVWIEIETRTGTEAILLVTPLAGVWIEMTEQ